ncbi:Phosphoesterase [Salinispira pacifica]|uniref:Phosphoesterase n=2 Tax=Salinispira pacifica TaxID=1307761 RepID=V5WG15_9SPIO|nr:Phosphoesterase [Salinispira pacifica]
MERTILAIGDIIGKPGMRALFAMLPKMKKTYKADLTIVNGENASDGFGLTPELADTIFQSGADVITSGNHIWQQREIYRYLDEQPMMLRPANYPSGNPGHGSCIFNAGGIRLAVLNLQGRYGMWPIDCPFKKANELLRKVKSEADAVIVDFHAENPQEKEALAYHLDGKITALFGTHTHIQTADQRVLPSGTGFITDIGSTGPDQSIIGFDANIGIQRHLTDLPLRNEVSENSAVVSALVVRFDEQSPLTTTEIFPVREAAGF